MTSPLQLYENLIFLQQHLAKLTLSRHASPMRFVLSLGLIALFGTSAYAAPWDTVSLGDTQARQKPVIRPVQMQRGGSSNTLKTIEGLDLKIAATGLGKISAMALSADGTLYTADVRTGRIWTLTDRGQDGKIDLRRPLPHSFNAPTALAVIGSTLYVADRTAIWSVEAGKSPRELAGLSHANASSDPLILSASPNGASLVLGLTTKTQNHRILQLDAKTGQASLIGEGKGPLHAVALRAGSNIWTASGSQLSAMGEQGLDFKTEQFIKAIALPGQYETPENWPVRLNDHMIASQIGPGAMRLIAIPTEFGQVKSTPRILADGFLVPSGRSAWGKPGAMLMDKRGLFFADEENGNLWSLSPTPPPQPKITIVDTKSIPIPPSPEPSLAPKGALKIESSIKGTQIDASSTIIKPSSIEYGSKLIKDYDEKKALEEAEKAEEVSKKKRRLSRKRKQPDN